MKRKTRESKMVMIEPSQIGIPNRMLSAMDEPMTSYEILSIANYLDI
jgi:hypothetical protein